VTRKRAAVIGAGIAVGAVAAGAVGRTIVRRKNEHDLEAHLWDLPPDDLGMIESFDGSMIAARASGDPQAPVLLFVHGFSLDMTTWHEQWIDLSADFRCVVMDQRGHGRSGPPAHGNLSLRALGRDIDAVLDVVAPDRPAVVVGHSMGGMAAIALAEQRPELFGPRIAGLILVGCSSTDLVRAALGSVSSLLRPRLGIGVTAERVDRLRKAVFASPGDLRGTAVRLTQFGPDAPAHLVEHVGNLSERASSQVWTDGLSGLMEMDLRYALPRVTVPTLVVVGQHDRITPPAASVALAGELPDATLVVLEGAGHVAMLERPVELDREIRTFSRKLLMPASPKRRAKVRPKEQGG
jgi:pimeloyl-ACP methyl ester carboxylesterase